MSPLVVVVASPFSSVLVLSQIGRDPTDS
jgi:hypothetical protein